MFHHERLTPDFRSKNGAKLRNELGRWRIVVRPASIQVEARHDNESPSTQAIYPAESNFFRVLS